MTKQPTSLSTGKAYSGSNVHTLQVAAATNNFESNVWGTYRQITSRGGQVRKGEKGTRIAFVKFDWVTQPDGSQKQEFVVKHFTVFNTDQADWAQEVAA